MNEMKYYIQIDDSKTPNKVISTTTNPAELKETLSHIDVDIKVYVNVVGWLLQKRDITIEDGVPVIKEEKKKKKK